MSNELRFDGRVAIITGAGNGLGRAYALLLGQRGAKVLVNDISKEAAENVASAIRRSYGGHAHANPDSVDSWEGAQRIAQDAIRQFGRIDILINNAGILRDSSFIKMTGKQWNDVYKVHLFGTFALTRAVWNHMRDQRYGRIVMIASSSGLYGNFGQANYGSAKTGILGLANTLSREGQSCNILVNTVAPIAASKMTADILPPDLLRALRPELVAPLVAFLCHEQCMESGRCLETGAGWCAALRWQRTQGAFLPLSENMTIERVRDNWGKIGEWNSYEYPESAQSAFGPILKNLESLPPSGRGELEGNGSSRPEDANESLLPQLSGGNRGVNESVDVPATLNMYFSPRRHQYGSHDAILYALSVGMSANPLDQNDLPFTYELNSEPGELLVLPTFPVLWPHDLMSQITDLETFKFNPAMVLHGEQEVVVPRKLPAEANVLTRGKISHIYDKGKAAVVVFDSTSINEETGELLACNRSSLLVRGAGGFGGDRGSFTPPYDTLPDCEPDVQSHCQTEPYAALLYRLNGDRNPLHADPNMASMAGFEKPILHGLCSLGIAGRVLTQKLSPLHPENIKRCVL
eukprot:gb/GECG01014471.1/.p1 GENE.gb/GECG01014471.1/~~gb/GECG01014471.1/.p1  ORF type:complete len:578 (+),score=44.44 gb/GECG01014471.1/:1-1734(+)